MEPNTNAANGATQEAKGQTEGMNEAEFEKARQDGIAYETHRKALAQRAKLKEEAESLRDQLEQYRQKEMEAQGKYKELVESQRKRIAELEESTKKMSANYQWNVVGAQIKSELASRGVKSPDKALKFALATHREDLNTIEVDENYQVNSQDLGSFVDKFLMDNVDMGFINKTGVKDITPGRIETGEEPKPISKMSTEELMKHWEQNN